MSSTGQQTNFGLTIKQYRKVKGMSQSDLAAKLGVDGSYLSRIESGDRLPSDNLLRLIADALGVKTEQLMFAAGMVSEEELRHMGIILPAFEIAGQTLEMKPIIGSFDETRITTLEALLEQVVARLTAVENAHNELVDGHNALMVAYNEFKDSIEQV